MAQRRMFSPEIVCSDEFLDMPISSRDLYYQLGMRADDDGFIQPRSVMRQVGSSNDDLKVLLSKRFLLTFESGVVVIKHWLIHNMIRGDRYKPTRFQEEKKVLFIKENKAYTDWQPNGNQMAPQVRLGKVRLMGEKSPQSDPLKDNEESMAWNKQPDDEAEVFIDAESGDEIKPTPKVKRNYKQDYKIFKEVLSIEIPLNWTVNATQQKCADNLFTERGEKEIREALEKYLIVKDQEYCPQISSPHDLDSKWDKLQLVKKVEKQITQAGLAHEICL